MANCVARPAQVVLIMVDGRRRRFGPSIQAYAAIARIVSTDGNLLKIPLLSNAVYNYICNDIFKLGRCGFFGDLESLTKCLMGS